MEEKELRYGQQEESQKPAKDLDELIFQEEIWMMSDR